MARTVSKAKTITTEDRAILRSIYYRQSLPNKVFASGTSLLAQRLKILEMSGMIRRSGNQLELTDEGVILLWRAYGARKPPLVDFKRDARLDRGEQMEEFVVGSSLASEIAREVRSGK